MVSGKKSTSFYSTVEKNDGLIQVLFVDLKAELNKQSYKYNKNKITWGK